MKPNTLIALALLILVSTGCDSKHYTATATLQIVEPEYERMAGELEPNYIMSASNINVPENIMKSEGVLTITSDTLTEHQMSDAILALYNDGAHTADLPTILKEHRSVKGDQINRTLKVSYQHPRPDVARLVANTFAYAYIEYNIRLNTDGYTKAIEDLSLRADQQTVKIETLREELTTFAQQHHFNDRSLDAIEQDLGKELKARMTEHVQNSHANSQTLAAVTETERKLLELSKVRVQHNSRLRDLEVQEGFYNALKQREQQFSRRLSQGIQPNAIITEHAVIN